MAHISRRQRNGKVRYLARYTDPSGRERAKSFTRKKDAERFLTGIEDDKLRGTWTDPTLGRVQLAEWYALWRRATVELRPNTEARDERLFRLHILPRFGSSHWLRSPSTRCAFGSPMRLGKDWLRPPCGAPTSSSAKYWAPPSMPA
jgi:hypothetical protein